MNLSFLRPLYERSGPWVSVYLDASRDTERGPKEFGLRWRAARELVESDSDPATLDALERALTDHPTRPGRYGLAAFATAGEVGLVEALPEPPRKENAAVGPLPHAMPLVTQRGERIGWLRVVVDRTGADLIGATEGGLARTRRVKGSGDYPIRKAQPGGWSQPRYQRAAENTWEHNAKEIAEAVSEMAEATGAEVLVVAGDPHAHCSSSTCPNAGRTGSWRPTSGPGRRARIPNRSTT
jgi:hypothetical protein